MNPNQLAWWIASPHICSQNSVLPVLGIPDILVRIRMRNRTSGSGMRIRNTGTFTSFFKDKKS
jgi:hypothetical protein